MKQVWKFAVSLRVQDDQFSVSMPAGAQVLTVQPQHDRPCIWALVDPSADTESRLFRIAGTGHPIEEVLGQYIGTFQLMGGDLIFHVFEVDQ